MDKPHENSDYLALIWIGFTSNNGSYQERSGLFKQITNKYKFGLHKQLGSAESLYLVITLIRKHIRMGLL